MHRKEGETLYSDHIRRIIAADMHV